jgi:hypothetical protein
MDPTYRPVPAAAGTPVAPTSGDETPEPVPTSSLLVPLPTQAADVAAALKARRVVFVGARYVATGSQHTARSIGALAMLDSATGATLVSTTVRPIKDVESCLGPLTGIAMRDMSNDVVSEAALLDALYHAGATDPSRFPIGHDVTLVGNNIARVVADVKLVAGQHYAALVEADDIFTYRDPLFLSRSRFNFLHLAFVENINVSSAVTAEDEARILRWLCLKYAGVSRAPDLTSFLKKALNTMPRPTKEEMLRDRCDGVCLSARVSRCSCGAAANVRQQQMPLEDAAERLLQRLAGATNPMVVAMGFTPAIAGSDPPPPVPEAKNPRAHRGGGMGGGGGGSGAAFRGRGMGWHAPSGGGGGRGQGYMPGTYYQQPHAQHHAPQRHPQQLDYSAGPPRYGMSAAAAHASVPPPVRVASPTSSSARGLHPEATAWYPPTGHELYGAQGPAAPSSPSPVGGWEGPRGGGRGGWNGGQLGGGGGAPRGGSGRQSWHDPHAHVHGHHHHYHHQQFGTPQFHPQHHHQAPHGGGSGFPYRGGGAPWGHGGGGRGGGYDGTPGGARGFARQPRNVPDATESGAALPRAIRDSLPTEAQRSDSNGARRRGGTATVPQVFLDDSTTFRTFGVPAATTVTDDGLLPAQAAAGVWGLSTAIDNDGPSDGAWRSYLNADE